MASTKLMETKDGKKFYKISVSRGYGKSPYTMRWYVPEGWSKRAAERELKKVSAQFEMKCAGGEVVNRAQAKEKELAAQAEAAKLRTVQQYAEGVYMPTKETTFSENARSNYQMFLNKYIYPKIGSLLLIEVTPAIIQKLLIDFQKEGYAHATAVKLYNILNGVFEMAFLDDSIPMNPMLKVKRPAARKDEKPTPESEKSLTVEQLRYVLQCLENEPLKWRAFIYLLADTGIRRGECCALQWKDIDFVSGTITISRNLLYTPDAGVYEATPKNGKTRVVDVGTDVLKLLQDLQKEQAETAISKYVFTQDGTADPIHPQTPTRLFRKYGVKYGIENFHPHLLRHTNASLAITNGADVVSVSQRLGHSDPAVTLRMYAHANEESIRRAGQIVRDALKANA